MTLRAPSYMYMCILMFRSSSALFSTRRSTLTGCLAVLLLVLLVIGLPGVAWFNSVNIELFSQ